MQRISGIDVQRQQGALLGGGAWWLAGGIAPGDCVAAWQAKGAESASEALLNRANPGAYDASVVGNISWSAGAGWASNGTGGAHLLTGLTPAHPASVIASGTRVGGDGTFLGARTTTNSNDRLYLMPANGENRLYGYGTIGQVAGVVAAGTMALAGDQPYLDGVADGPSTGGSIATLAKPLVLMALNNGGIIQILLNGTLAAAAVYSVILSPAQIVAVTAAMQAL